MERLTCKFEDLNTLRAMCSFDRESDTEPDDCDSCQEICIGKSGDCEEECPIQQAFDRLADYENLSEQGRLLELPCKVGDTVFAIVNRKIVQDVVDRIEINERCSKISTKEHSWLYNFDKVFLTKSEAEQALAERQG